MSKSDAVAAPDAVPVDLISHPVGLIRFDDAPAARFNPSACSLLGRPFAGKRWLPLAEAVGNAAAQNLLQLAREMARNGAGAKTKAVCETPKGALPVRFELARLGKSDQIMVAALSAARTDPSALSEVSQLYRVLQTLPVGLELFDPQFNALFYNAKSDELFDYWNGAIQNHDEWWEFAFPDDAERQQALVEWRKTVAAARADPSRAHLAEWTVTCRDGERRTVQFYYRFLGDRFSLMLWDVTEQRRLESELRELARTDSLTGLANRRSFFERAQTLLADRRTAGPLTVLMLDLDHFKSVNDTFGHSVGDEVLTEVSRRAQMALRKDDLLARMGGEEFAALLPRTGPAEAEAVAQRLRRAIAEKPLTAADLSVTVSVGSASRLAGEIEIDALIARADVALYAAKAGGRNCVVSAETMDAS